MYLMEHPQIEIKPITAVMMINNTISAPKQISKRNFGVYNYLFTYLLTCKMQNAGRSHAFNSYVRQICMNKICNS